MKGFKRFFSKPYQHHLIEIFLNRKESGKEVWIIPRFAINGTPDRDLSLRRLEHRALQLGIRGSVVHNYVNTWILEIEEVTELAHHIRDAVNNKLQKIPDVPQEKVYQVNSEIRQTLRIVKN